MINMKSPIPILLSLVIFFIGCESSDDQTIVSLSGKVLYQQDSISIAASGALVQIATSPKASNTLFTLKADDNGTFQILLETGDYYVQSELEIEKDSMTSTFKMAPILLELRAPTNIRIDLFKQ